MAEFLAALRWSSIIVVTATVSASVVIHGPVARLGCREFPKTLCCVSSKTWCAKYSTSCCRATCSLEVACAVRCIQSYPEIQALTIWARISLAWAKTSVSDWLGPVEADASIDVGLVAVVLRLLEWPLCGGRAWSSKLPLRANSRISLV